MIFDVKISASNCTIYAGMKSARQTKSNDKSASRFVRLMDVMAHIHMAKLVAFPRRAFARPSQREICQKIVSHAYALQFAQVP